MSLTQRLNDVAALLASAATPELDAAMEQAIALISTALKARRPLLVAGNGGSMADSLHIAGELVSRFLIDRRGFKVISLGANLSALTAWSNDTAYETAMAREVDAYGEEGGVFLGISTSGNSGNVVAAAQKAKELGMSVIALTGAGKGEQKGGILGGLADVLMAAPSVCTPRIQEVHLALYHYLCEQVEKACA